MLTGGGRSTAAVTCPAGASGPLAVGEQLARVPPKLMARIRDSACSLWHSDPPSTPWQWRGRQLGAGEVSP